MQGLHQPMVAAQQQSQHIADLQAQLPCGHQHHRMRSLSPAQARLLALHPPQSHHRQWCSCLCRALTALGLAYNSDAALLPQPHLLKQYKIESNCITTLPRTASCRADSRDVPAYLAPVSLLTPEHEPIWQSSMYADPANAHMIFGFSSCSTAGCVCGHRPHMTQLMTSWNGWEYL